MDGFDYHVPIGLPHGIEPVSGIIGHTMYALLGGRAALQEKLPVAPLLQRHFASYMAGSYLGCDIQTMPEAICVDTGQEVGYGTASIDNSPLTGGAIKTWTLKFGNNAYRPRDIHRTFYGRSHVIFGWSPAERMHAVPWDHLADYAASVVQDAIDLFGPGHRKIAYLFGWMAHIVGDSLIKSIQSGLTLKLLDGKYTPANRPIQDLVTFHEIGRKELGVDWKSLLSDLSETPVEEVQLHYMRTGQPRGLLATQFPNAWAPQHAPLLRRVLAENRRYQGIRTPRQLKLYALKKVRSEWHCDPLLSRQAGGLSYQEMVRLADQADFRHALWQMGEAILQLFQQVTSRVRFLQELPFETGPSWSDLTSLWRKTTSSP